MTSTTFQKSIQAISYFLFGITLPIQALRLILKHKSLLILCLLPIVLTLALHFFILTHLNDYLLDYLHNYLQTFKALSNEWIAILFSILIKLCLFFVSVLTFTFTSTVVASPFNDFLAERTEKFTPGISPAPGFSLINTLRLLYIDLAKSITLLAIGFLSIVFFWVPILNIVGFILTFLLLSFQYITYPQTRRGLTFQKSVVFLKNHFFACLGFGSILFFLYAIPFMSSFILPLAVVGGTLLYAQGEKNLI